MLALTITAGMFLGRALMRDRELLAFRGITAAKARCAADTYASDLGVGVRPLRCKIGEANLNAEIVGSPRTVFEQAPRRTCRLPFKGISAKLKKRRGRASLNHTLLHT